ncbi:hypothetical protein FACS1894208_09090 [Clostridia bacterium]|nr:hypothetical protein FACS1894208_09090 [Clostridia bacterium]
MPRKSRYDGLTKREIEREKLRDKAVYKADTLIQHSRFTLTITEQRLILFTISAIKPTDSVFKAYHFPMSDFFEICGIKGKESYFELKKTIVGLQKKFWWIDMIDEEGCECESSVNWFSTCRITKPRKGNEDGIDDSRLTVTIKFHEDMMPYLLELAKNFEDNGEFYSHYTFKHVLPMKSQYGPRLYEILFSYAKNNEAWCFDLAELRKRLDCQTIYPAYKDFRINVIEPAIREINTYTDIIIGYEPEKRGHRVAWLHFNFRKKNTAEKISAEKRLLTALDGDVHYWDADGTLIGKQVSMLDLDGNA